jgi:hypothetical protein
MLEIRSKDLAEKYSQDLVQEREMKLHNKHSNEYGCPKNSKPAKLFL